MPNYQRTESLYFSYNIGPVHFIALSTEVYYYGGKKKMNRIAKMYEWFEQDLKVYNELFTVNNFVKFQKTLLDYNSLL